MIAEVAHGTSSAAEIVCVVIVILAIVLAIVGVLELVNVVRTRAAWWAWLLAALIVFLGWVIFC
jgi:uncharacterized membrane protein